MASPSTPCRPLPALQGAWPQFAANQTAGAANPFEHAGSPRRTDGRTGPPPRPLVNGPGSARTWSAVASGRQPDRRIASGSRQAAQCPNAARKPARVLDVTHRSSPAIRTAIDPPLAGRSASQRGIPDARRRWFVRYQETATGRTRPPRPANTAGSRSAVAGPPRHSAKPPPSRIKLGDSRKRKAVRPEAEVIQRHGAARLSDSGVSASYRKHRDVAEQPGCARIRRWDCVSTSDDLDLAGADVGHQSRQAGTS